MPAYNDVRVNQGPYEEVFKKFDAPQDAKKFFDEIGTEQTYIETLITIFKDIRRQPVELREGVTDKDHVNTWMDVANSVAQTYAQGNLDATFAIILINWFVFSSRYLKEGTKRTLNNAPYFCNFTDEEEYARFSRSYYIDAVDEKNKPIKIPCGISILVSKRDPSIWVMSCFKNSKAHPKDMEVMLVTPPDLMNNSNEGRMDHQEAEARFLDFVGDKTIRAMLEQNNEEPGIFLPTGEVNAKKIDRIYENSQWISNEQKERTEIKQKQLEIIKTLYEQYRDTQDNLTLAEQKKAFADRKQNKLNKLTETFNINIKVEKSYLDKYKKEKKNQLVKCAKKYQNAHKKKYAALRNLGALFIAGLVLLIVAALFAPVSIPLAVVMTFLIVSILATVLLASVFKIRKAEKNSQQELKTIKAEYKSFCKEKNYLINQHQKSIQALQEEMKNAESTLLDKIKAEERQFKKNYYDTPLLIELCQDVMYQDDLSEEDVKRYCAQRFSEHSQSLKKETSATVKQAIDSNLDLPQRRKKEEEKAHYSHFYNSSPYNSSPDDSSLLDKDEDVKAQPSRGVGS